MAKTDEEVVAAIRAAELRRGIVGWGNPREAPRARPIVGVELEELFAPEVLPPRLGHLLEGLEDLDQEKKEREGGKPRAVSKLKAPPSSIIKKQASTDVEALHHSYHTTTL